MIVMKFGGTSVQDAAAMRTVAQIIEAWRAREPLVVVSACAGVTNTLIAIARGAVGGGRTRSLEQVEELRVFHRKIAHELFNGEILFSVQALVDALLDDLRDLVKSIAILGELTNRSLDTFASFGERLSSVLLYHHLGETIEKLVLLDVREVMITDDRFAQATPLEKEIGERSKKVIAPKLKGGEIVLTQGFIGATRDGITTTLGRGGSDYSAAILGGSLHAEEIQIWTDVDGVMSCDPRLVPSAKLLETLSFQEASELAYFGAKVLHPSTIVPAIHKNIPVRVLNSKNPQGNGTTIVREARIRADHPVKAIACKRDISMLNIRSTRMLLMPGYLARVFEVFSREGMSVDVIATSEVSISLTVDSVEHIDGIVSALKEFADVEVRNNMATICVVGDGLGKKTNVPSRVLATLNRADVDVSILSLGASRVNISIVVDSADVQKAVNCLHEEFL